MGAIVTAILNAASGLMPSIGLWDVFAATLLLLGLIISNIIGRVALWIESTVLRS